YGSVVRSWLLELLHDAMESDPGLEKIRGYVDDSGEGRWTIEAAMEENVPAPITSIALFNRFASRQEESFSAKVIAALRNEFGGQEPSGEKWDAFAEHLGYVAGEFSDKGAMDHLVEHVDGFEDRIGKPAGRFFYAATPSSVDPDIVDRVGETGLAAGSKIVF